MGSLAELPAVPTTGGAEGPEPGAEPPAPAGAGPAPGASLSPSHASTSSIEQRSLSTAAQPLASTQLLNRSILWAQAWLRRAPSVSSSRQFFEQSETLAMPVLQPQLSPVQLQSQAASFSQVL